MLTSFMDVPYWSNHTLLIKRVLWSGNLTFLFLFVSTCERMDAKWVEHIFLERKIRAQWVEMIFSISLQMKIVFCFCKYLLWYLWYVYLWQFFDEFLTNLLTNCLSIFFDNFFLYIFLQMFLNLDFSDFSEDFFWPITF